MGECFGASGLMPGDGTRRNTATALSEVTLKVIPHNHFRVMVRDDSYIKVQQSQLKQLPLPHLAALCSAPHCP